MPILKACSVCGAIASPPYKQKQGPRCLRHQNDVAINTRGSYAWQKLRKLAVARDAAFVAARSMGWKFTWPPP
jgi:hypothetical protein